jgi:hypothetical protein
MGVLNQLLVVLLHVMLLSTYAYVRMTRTTGMTRRFGKHAQRSVVSREGKELCILLPEALLVEGPVTTGYTINLLSPVTSLPSLPYSVVCRLSSLLTACPILLPLRLLTLLWRGRYGRGSKSLGVPTANLPHFSEQLQTSTFANGVYFGWAHVRGDNSVYPVVANIGTSPTFVGHENAVAIIESHLLGRENGGKNGSGSDMDTDTDTDTRAYADSNAVPQFSDFYGRPMAVALVGYMRSERRFEGVDALVAQIRHDLSAGRALAALADEDAGSDVAAARCVVAPFLDTRSGPCTPALDTVTTTTTFRVPLAGVGDGGGIDSVCTYGTLALD